METLYQLIELGTGTLAQANKAIDPEEQARVRAKAYEYLETARLCRQLRAISPEQGKHPIS